MTLATRILTSRFLTHTGDQAWDFAVPLVLLKILPGQLHVAAFYYLLIQLSFFILFPKLSSVMDRIHRTRALRIGLGLQIVGVLVSSFALISLASSFYLSFAVLALGGAMTKLGSVFMDVFIANDLVPAIFSAQELARINSRLRQMDLITEVTIPILAGLMLLIELPGFGLFGFTLLALWNLLSFIPEYFLLNSVLQLRPDLREKQPFIAAQERVSLLEQLSRGWRTFFKEPVALPVLAYTFLCLTVLSPHGMLITGFLKDGWKLPETEIGIFRGAGAAFGLLATVFFQPVTKRFGLKKGARLFIWFQAIVLLVAAVAFVSDNRVGQIGFLMAVVFSRVGLYGFSLGEVEIRQLGIPENRRGQVNGFAHALSCLPNLLLYAVAALFSSTSDFFYFVWASAFSILTAALIFTYWTWRPSLRVTTE